MNKYRLAFAAERDLEEIEAYIAKDSRAAAEEVINNIESTCQLLADYPGVGSQRNEIERGVMSFPIGSYLIYYRVGEDDVVGIARIIHSSRDTGPAFHDQ